MGREPRDHIQRQVRTLELRVSIDHHGNIDGVGDSAEIGFDLRVGDRKVRLQNCEDAVGTELLICLRLRHGVRR